MCVSAFRQATEVTKLERKSLVSYIYIGQPRAGLQAMLGTEPRIQLNDQFATTDDIFAFIASEREARDEAEIPYMRTSLKVDNEVRMGIVDDVKQALRRANALNINYSTLTTDDIFQLIAIFKHPKKGIPHGCPFFLRNMLSSVR
jgi:hypothetical protein